MIGEGSGSAEGLRAEAVKGGRDLIATFNAAREAGIQRNHRPSRAITAAGHVRSHDLGNLDAELKWLSVRRNDPRATSSAQANAGAPLASLQNAVPSSVDALSAFTKRTLRLLPARAGRSGDVKLEQGF